MALTKARLLKHDFPVHGQRKDQKGVIRGPPTNEMSVCYHFSSGGHLLRLECPQYLLAFSRATLSPSAGCDINSPPLLKQSRDRYNEPHKHESETSR